MVHSPFGGEKENDEVERLPLPGKGGTVQLAVGWVENISLLVKAPRPPVITSPTKGKFI